MLVRLTGAFARAALLIRPRSHVRLAAVIANGDVFLVHVSCLLYTSLRTGSLLICSQFSPAGWHAKLGEGAIADAVIDRIVYRSDIIHIEGDESMRKRIG